MARTKIQILAETAQADRSWMQVTPANVVETLSQASFLSYRNPQTVRLPIIQGDGVNNQAYGFLPGLAEDTYNSADEVGAGDGTQADINSFNISEGDTSIIFDNINAGGENIKHTKFIYTYYFKDNPQHWGNFDTSNLLDLIDSQIFATTYVLDIYWGKYIEIYQTPRGDTMNFFPGTANVKSLDGLEGSFDIADWMLDNLSPNKFLSESAPDASQAIFSINLDTKTISSIPLRRHAGAYHSWVIETEDFEYAAAAADPVEDPAADPVEDPAEVDGVKISQLEKITSFNPTDLMIVSRDEDDNGTYDKSFAIDPTLLRDSARSNIGTEKPSDPKNGEFWFDENTANLYIYTEALNSWIQI